jgi:uncharacterized membrane protein
VRKVWHILLKGLAAVLPVALTLYLVYWLGTSIERVLRPTILWVVPESLYLPGMGLATGLVLLFFIGLLVNAWIVQRLLQFGEQLLEKIPLIKSVYGALRDFMGYFSAAGQRRDLKQVVLVTLGDTRLLGFITQERVEDLPGVSLQEDVVAVYLPMSYQIGGYTLYVPRSSLQPVDLSIEEAMRRILTAGLSQNDGTARKRAEFSAET